MVKLCSSLSWSKIPLKCKYLGFYCGIINILYIRSFLFADLFCFYCSFSVLSLKVEGLARGFRLFLFKY